MATNSCSSIQSFNNWRLWIWKKNSLFNLINHQPDINKMYLCPKDPNEAKYSFLNKKREDVETKHDMDDMDDIYKKIE